MTGLRGRFRIADPLHLIWIMPAKEIVFMNISRHLDQVAIFYLSFREALSLRATEWSKAITIAKWSRNCFVTQIVPRNDFSYYSTLK